MTYCACSREPFQSPHVQRWSTNQIGRSKCASGSSCPGEGNATQDTFGIRCKRSQLTVPQCIQQLHRSCCWRNPQQKGSCDICWHACSNVYEPANRNRPALSRWKLTCSIGVDVSRNTPIRVMSDTWFSKHRHTALPNNGRLAERTAQTVSNICPGTFRRPIHTRHECCAICSVQGSSVGCRAACLAWSRLVEISVRCASC